MNIRLIAALGGTLLGSISAAAFAQGSLPSHAVPAGFQSTDGSQGGRRLTGTLAGPFASPSEALAATMHRLHAYFTGPLPVGSAVASGDRVIVFFRGHLERTPIVGVTVIAPTHDRGAAVESLFDTPGRAGRSLPKLVSPASSRGSSAAAIAVADVPLTRQRFADGSGTIGVPYGWRMLGGNRGMVDLLGPDGAQAHISIQFPVWDPRAGLADPRRMQVPFIAEPVQAMIAVWNRSFSIRGAEAPALDVLDAQPVNPPMGAGRAALVHGRTHGARPLEFVTLTNSAPMSSSAWMFYYTTLSAPPQRFHRDYPVMLAIWKSYQADAAYEHGLAADTAGTLHDAANMLNGATQRSITAQDQTNAGMDNIINGQEIVETTADGVRRHGDADAANVLAQKYPDKYRIVPTNEYRSGDY